MDGIGRTLAGGPPATAASRVAVYAHRGFHPDQQPYENSLGAFNAAVDLGVDSLELDIHRTADGALVVHHDAAVADGREIKDMTVAQLPLLPDGQPIPTFDQVISLARSRGAHLAVELKATGFEQQAVETLTSSLTPEQYDVISFNASSIQQVEELAPQIRTGLLAPRIWPWFRHSPLMPAASWLMDRLGWHPALSSAAKIGADYVSADAQMVTPSFMRDAQRRSTPVMAWTVDDPQRMRDMIDAGVVGIVTNRSDVALKVRDEVR